MDTVCVDTDGTVLLTDYKFNVTFCELFISGAKYSQFFIALNQLPLSASEINQHSIKTEVPL